MHVACLQPYMHANIQNKSISFESIAVYLYYWKFNHISCWLQNNKQLHNINTSFIDEVTTSLVISANLN